MRRKWWAQWWAHLRVGRASRRGSSVHIATSRRVATEPRPVTPEAVDSSPVDPTNIHEKNRRRPPPDCRLSFYLPTSQSSVASATPPSLGAWRGTGA